ncbi:hypothetical protein MXB_29, partial [Myxobolus squamalis]
CSNIKEIKSKIELIFYDKNRNRCRAVRSISAFQKNHKLETKTTESFLEIEERNGKKRNITTRSGDLAKEIPDLLGVSKPIIEYVIFCHHDDSCWPLGESKILKERFDEIFETTSYNKALESIRSVRKQKFQSINDTQSEVIKLKQIHDKVTEIKNRIIENHEEIIRKNNAIADLTKNVDQINVLKIYCFIEKIKINSLNEKKELISGVQRKIDEFMMINQRLSFEIEECYTNLSSRTESLNKEIEDTKSTEQQVLIKIGKMENELNLKNRDTKNIVSEIDQIHLKLERVQKACAEKNKISLFLSDKNNQIIEINKTDLKVLEGNVESLEIATSELNNDNRKLQADLFENKNNLAICREYESKQSQLKKYETDISTM